MMMIYLLPLHYTPFPYPTLMLAWRFFTPLLVGTYLLNCANANLGFLDERVGFEIRAKVEYHCPSLIPFPFPVGF